MMDGINVNIEWNKFSLIDYFLTVKFKMRPLFSRNWEFRYASKFDGYDLIVANSTSMGDLAYNISKKYGIPYYVIWHGTDIHSAPFDSQYQQLELLKLQINYGYLLNQLFEPF